VIKDPETYERFEKVVLLHGCRRVKELAYGEMITEKLPNDELIGEYIRNQLVYYPTVTRESLPQTAAVSRTSSTPASCSLISGWPRSIPPMTAS